MIMEKDLITEERIKRSARNVFQRKGFSGARIAEIADNAGINRAMIHYYYRDKKSLFDIIMQESIVELLNGINCIINDKQTTLTEKIEMICGNFHDLLSDNRDLPMFVLNEIQSSSRNIIDSYLSLLEGKVSDSIFFRQLEEHIKEQKLDGIISARQVFINIVALSVFPFLGSKLLIRSLDLNGTFAFDELTMERKVQEPLWIQKMLNL